MVIKTECEFPTYKEEISHDHLFRVTGLSSNNLEKLGQAEPKTPADFETAIAATGYGRFNIILLLCTMPAFWSAVSVTSSVSFIFTSAQCDMQLTLLDMGTMNAITYIGMISSAMVWGFLSDTLGRKKILVWGFFCSGLVEIASSMSQNLPMLLVTRFLCGFLANGPFAVLISYLGELHRTKLRARVILLTCLFFTLANMTLPLLAWGVLTNNWTFKVWDDKIVIHSWNVFLLITALIPLITGVAFHFMPESPKFLMSRGRHEEALEVFKKIFIQNTGKSKEEFPITSLTEEKQEMRTRGLQALRGGTSQLAPLFMTPQLSKLLMICFIHAGVMFGSNTLRLWYPHLSALLSSGNSDLCSAIKPNPKVDGILDVCVPIETDMMNYLQSCMVGAGSTITYIIGGILINICGKKILTGICSIACGLIVFFMPVLGIDGFSVMAMMMTGLAMTSLSGATLSSICVDLFPTSLRVMAMAIFLMCGRFGTIAGTITFPALIDLGCLPPFVTIASVLTVCGIFSFFLPNTTLKKLE